MLALGADVNAANTKGLTPLHYAAGIGSHDLVTLLLANEAQVNSMAEKVNRITPLMLATLMGHDLCVSSLLDKGAGVNLQTDHGMCQPSLFLASN